MFLFIKAVSYFTVNIFHLVIIYRIFDFYLAGLICPLSKQSGVGMKYQPAADLMPVLDFSDS